MDIDNSKITKCLENFHSIWACKPHKLTWIRQDLCYICGGEDINVKTYYIKSCLKWRFGYIACGKCKVLLNQFEEICQENGIYIPNTIIDQTDIKFYRFSRSNKLKPYIQKGELEPILNPVFSKPKKILTTIVSWNNLSKSIPLSNLIFYNRDIYGYAICEGPFRHCKSIWYSDLQNSYATANRFFHFYKFCIKQTKFDMLVIMRIYKYWVYDLI